MTDDDELTKEIERTHLAARQLERDSAERETEAGRLLEEAERLRADVMQHRAKVHYLRTQQARQWEQEQAQKEQPHPDGDMGRYDAFSAELRHFLDVDGGDVALDIGDALYFANGSDGKKDLSVVERVAGLGDFMLSVAMGFERAAEYARKEESHA